MSKVKSLVLCHYGLGLLREVQVPICGRDFGDRSGRASLKEGWRKELWHGWAKLRRFLTYTRVSNQQWSLARVFSLPEHTLPGTGRAAIRTRARHLRGSVVNLAIRRKRTVSVRRCPCQKAHGVAVGVFTGLGAAVVVLEIDSRHCNPTPKPVGRFEVDNSSASGCWRLHACPKRFGRSKIMLVGGAVTTKPCRV
jgi:hypothetical protein